jgi:hypothetical protein
MNIIIVSCCKYYQSDKLLYAYCSRNGNTIDITKAKNFRSFKMKGVIRLKYSFDVYLRVNGMSIVEIDGRLRKIVPIYVMNVPTLTGFDIQL